MDGRCRIVGAPPVRRECCPRRKRETRAPDRAQATDRTPERCLPSWPRGSGWRYGAANPLQRRDRTSADRLARSFRYRPRRDPAQMGCRTGPPAGRPQPLARADEDRQRARPCALARHRRYGQAGLAAGLRRAGRKPRALGPSALGIARRRHAGAARARGRRVTWRRFRPTRSRATISRSAPTPRRRRRRRARRSAPKRPAPARAKRGRAGPAPSTSSP